MNILSKKLKNSKQFSIFSINEINEIISNSLVNHVDENVKVTQLIHEKLLNSFNQFTSHAKDVKESKRYPFLIITIVSIISFHYCIYHILLRIVSLYLSSVIKKDISLVL